MEPFWIFVPTLLDADWMALLLVWVEVAGGARGRLASGAAVETAVKERRLAKRMAENCILMAKLVGEES